MSKICKIDSSEIDNILNNLNEENRKKALFNSLVKGGQELVKETQSELLSVLPNGKSMLKGIRLKKDKNYDEVKVHIMGDYRLKFFEMGTEERYLKKPLPKKNETNELKSGSKNSGGTPYRGKISPKYFFQKAREHSNMVSVMIEKLINEINKLMK